VQDDDFPAAIRPPAVAFQALGENGAPIDCPPLIIGQTKLCNGIAYSSVDRTRIRTTTGGASAQATHNPPLFDRPNLFAAGLSYDESHLRFSADPTLGLIFRNLSVRTAPGEVVGAGQIIHRGQP
jgi:hypothetical protein